MYVYGTVVCYITFSSNLKRRCHEDLRCPRTGVVGITEFHMGSPDSQSHICMNMPWKVGLDDSSEAGVYTN